MNNDSNVLYKDVEYSTARTASTYMCDGPGQNNAIELKSNSMEASSLLKNLHLVPQRCSKTVHFIRHGEGFHNIGIAPTYSSMKRADNLEANQGCKSVVHVLKSRNLVRHHLPVPDQCSIAGYEENVDAHLTPYGWHQAAALGEHIRSLQPPLNIEVC